MHQGLLDLHDTNLHVACEIFPLDFQCLAGMGLVSKVNGRYSFSPTGPPRSKQMVTWDQEDPVSSNVPLSLPAPSAAAFHALEAQVTNIEQIVTHLKANLDAFFMHAGFTPPFPSRT